ncbi:MAG: hypothetical protein AAB869_01195 [Patescibacteria group bacterium]
MSATNEQGKGYPANADRIYEALIYIEFDFFSKTYDLLPIEKLKQCILGVACAGNWGKNRSDWTWDFDDSAHNRLSRKWGRDTGGYMIETYCSIKHSQIHAFENFVINFAEKLVANMPGLRVTARSIFKSVAITLGSDHD